MLDYPVSLLARALGARLHGSGEGVVRRVEIDSRKVQPGDLFVALPGARVDGHDFIPQARAAGAVAVLAGARRVPAAARAGGPLLAVPDPVAALGELAAWHRDRFAVRMVAVTGSVGKTSTKDFVAGVLAGQWETLKSPGNLNTEIGLPLALLALESRHEAMVVELAMRGPGQIRALARLARPHVAVITNIGLSHVEVLGSQDAIAEAKAEVLDFLPEGGCAVLNTDDAYHGFLRGRVPPWARAIGFGMERAGAPEVTGIYSGPARDFRDGQLVWGTRLHLLDPRLSNPQRAFLPVLGRHNALNALAAAAVGLSLGVHPKVVAQGLGRAEISGQRMDAVRTPRGLVLDDSYNASSPEAMEGALSVLREVPGERKIAVLADMLELGRHSARAHRRVGAAVAEARPDVLVTVGEAAARFAPPAAKAGVATFPCATREEAIAALRGLLRPDDVVLVKGSRGMQMEQVVAALREGF